MAINDDGYDADEIPELAILSVTAWIALVKGEHPEETRYAELFGIDDGHLERPEFVIHQVFSARLNDEVRGEVHDGASMLLHICGPHAFPHVDELYWAYEADDGDSPTTRAERRAARIKAGCHSRTDIFWLWHQEQEAAYSSASASNSAPRASSSGTAAVVSIRSRTSSRDAGR